MMSRFSEVRRRLLSKFPPILFPGYRKKDMILAGSGRSGTTWLLNILSSLPGYRVIFEPFHENNCEVSFLPPRPYVRPYDKNKELVNYINTLLSKRIKNEFINSQNKKLIAYQTIIKFIRANLALDWISRNFQVPIIFMIRHPCAVVLSRIKLNWGSHLNEFLRQKELMQDYLAPYESLIWNVHNGNKEHEKYALMWAIENSIPLKLLPNRQNWCLVTYEELFLNRKPVLSNLLRHLGHNYNKAIEAASYQKSYTVREHAMDYNKASILSRWTEELSKEMTRDILDIAAKFEIRLYDEQPIPRKLGNREDNQ